MIRPKKMGRLIVIGTILLALFVAIMSVIIFNNWLGSKNIGDTGEKLITEEEIAQVDISEIYHENYWAKSVVSNIVEEKVPIPVGFDYVQGNLETGIIVKNNETSNYMMWIPYNSDANIEGVAEYYKNCQYEEEIGDIQESRGTYGGFYIELEDTNQYEILKQIDEESLGEAKTKAEDMAANIESLNSHLVTKQELAQIKAYEEKIGTKLISTKLSGTQDINKIQISEKGAVKKLSTIGSQSTGVVAYTFETYISLTEKMEGKDIAKIKLRDGTYVYIPNGYKLYVGDNKGSFTQKSYKDYSEINKDIPTIDKDETIIVKISKDDKFFYTWIPIVEDIDKLEILKEKLNNVYLEEDKFQYSWNAYDYLEGKTDNATEYNELYKSVKQYGGFYMAEAEMGHDKNGENTNKARGFCIYQGEDGQKLVGINKEDGEYYRGVAEKDAKDICKELSDDVVVSHLAYGCEWDATMLWILKTGALTNKDVITDSTNVPGAKYAELIYDYLLNKESGKYVVDGSDGKVTYVNGLYGLAGNLMELTQEKTNYTPDVTKELENGEFRYIARGGSYAYNQNDPLATMASRLQLTEESIKNKDIGFRNCLYLKTTKEVQKDTSTTAKLDKFSFINDDKYFRNNYKIENTLYEKLMGTYTNKPMSETVRSRVKRQMTRKWNGSCHGLSAIVALKRNGIFSPQDWQVGAKKIEEFEIPKVSDNVNNIIQFYHLMQLLPDMPVEPAQLRKK